jgi:hypothetical protein
LSSGNESCNGRSVRGQRTVTFIAILVGVSAAGHKAQVCYGEQQISSGNEQWAARTPSSICRSFEENGVQGLHGITHIPHRCFEGGFSDAETFGPVSNFGFVAQMYHLAEIV